MAPPSPKTVRLYAGGPPFATNRMKELSELYQCCLLPVLSPHCFDKKGPHAGKISVKHKDDPNSWTHSLLREGYGKDKHWILLGLPSRDSA